MENFTHPLLNSIFSETHQELQTLQKDFSYLQTHFIIENFEDNLNNNKIEKSEKIINNNEEDFIKKINKTICCQNNCLKEKINTKKAFLRNFNFQNLSKNNQDSFLMGYFIGISNLKKNTSKGNKRVRISYDYSFDSEEICLQAFKFIYGVGSTRIENIRTHLSTEDIKIRVHKSAGKLSHTAIFFSTIINIINFTLSYANKWGLPSP
ncbi:7508_t:CDS:2, partial [Gigaspora rosea]